mmetsp:Transcript_8058/g.15636  ORF Transcript_8058/g.15636 Transcript_8058/m.15636 type:complete len:117 (-) Transcript_8058:52-402(-)
MTAVMDFCDHGGLQFEVMQFTIVYERKCAIPSCYNTLAPCQVDFETLKVCGWQCQVSSAAVGWDQLRISLYCQGTVTWHNPIDTLMHGALCFVVQSSSLLFCLVWIFHGLYWCPLS